MPISLKEHQERAKKREDYFIKMIQATRKVSEKSARRVMAEYRKRNISERKKFREATVDDYKAIAYGDKPQPERPKLSIVVPPVKKEKKADKYKIDNWYPQWLKDKGITLDKSGKPVGKVSPYENRIISGYNKNKHLNPTLTDLRGH